MEINRTLDILHLVVFNKSHRVNTPSINLKESVTIEAYEVHTNYLDGLISNGVTLYSSGACFHLKGFPQIFILKLKTIGLYNLTYKPALLYTDNTQHW